MYHHPSERRRGFRIANPLALCRSKQVWILTITVMVLLLVLYYHLVPRLSTKEAIRHERPMPHCMREAKTQEEPYSVAYTQRSSIQLDGPIYAFYLWEGPITRDDFESTLSSTDSKVTIKIKDNQLLEKSSNLRFLHREIDE